VNQDVWRTKTFLVWAEVVRRENKDALFMTTEKEASYVTTGIGGLRRKYIIRDD
jgi:hypothetical protein